MKKEEKKYNHKEIEKKWIEKWEKEKIFSPDLDKVSKPFYNLMMFPYPSAEGLHVGNMYAFTGADVYGRFKRMQGSDVFQPMGLDGFGIHSENYALKIGIHPMEQAEKSEKNFYRQLRATGNAYDWTRTLETYDPDYYKWTQWIFVQMFKNGLAYRKKAQVNWCPSCKTVLSDEQVISGECERCGSTVEKKELEQWFFKITDYAERLLNNIDKLNWSEKVKVAQKNWIGKSEGARVKFKIKGAKGVSLNEVKGDSLSEIEVFTTRPDTLFGATFMVLSPEHYLVQEILRGVYTDPPSGGERAQNDKEIKDYVEKAKKKTEQERIAEGREKTGIDIGVKAINPVTNQEIPIFIADYVLMSYGTGAIMGVPAHDARDFEFAKKYNVPIKEVVISDSRLKNQESREKAKNHNSSLKEAYEGNGIIVNSDEWSGWKYPEDKEKVIAWLEKRGIGTKEVHYHLRDWLISRQRYWGPPIPMVYCSKCADEGKSWFDTEEGLKIKDLKLKNKAKNHESLMNGWYPVSEDQLPVKLPKIENYKPLGIHSTSSGQAGKAPLANYPEFYEANCLECGSKAKRETDVSDTFLDSAWYFFRYLCTECRDRAFDNNRVKKWLPVDMYTGGAEHSVLHLLYSRFMTMFFHDLGLIDFEEPYKRFFAHGLLIKEGAKMSKSKGNVVVPDTYIEKYGSDTLRCYLMFLGPFSQGGDFYDSGIEGMNRFIKRVWVLFTQSQTNNMSLRVKKVNAVIPKSSEIASSAFGETRNNNERRRMMHKTIKGVTEDIEGLRYNTAIAKLMEWHNYLKSKIKSQKSKVTEEETIVFLKLLSPFAPHLTEEVYNSMIYTDGVFSSIHHEKWPVFDSKYLVEENVTVVVQINGKKRGEISILLQDLENKQKVEQNAKSKVQKYLDSRQIKKVIYVSGKIINFVI